MTESPQQPLPSADPVRAAKLKGLTIKDLERARQLIYSTRLTPRDRMEMEALLTGLDHDLGPDPSRFPKFDQQYLYTTAPGWWSWTWPQQLALYPVLQKVRSGELKRVIIVWPPRHTKTETATVRFPAYWLETTPDQHVIVAAHTQKLANKISRKIRRLAPGRFNLSASRSAVEEWETLEGGGCRAVGVGVAIAGYGGNLIFVDDPIRRRKDAESEAYRDSVWDWFTDDLYTRLEPGGSIVMVMTRWHEDDPVGRVLASSEASTWTVIHLPALAMDGDLLGRTPGQALCPDRYNEEDLAAIRRVEGSYGFAALYQGMPAPPEGGIFKRTWWRFHAPAHLLGSLPPVQIRLLDGSYFRVPAVPTPVKFAAEAQSWDMAFKARSDSDFVCGQHWGRAGASFYLLDQLYQHLDFPGTLAAVRGLRAIHPNTVAVWVEDKANGSAVIQSLRYEIPGLIAVEPEGGKEARAHAISPLVEAGNVYLPHPGSVPTINGKNWVLDLIESCAVLPNGAHDDDADALTQGLNRLRRYAGVERQYVTVRPRA